jgi:hypothetical protein
MRLIEESNRQGAGASWLPGCEMGESGEFKLRGDGSLQ